MVEIPETCISDGKVTLTFDRTDKVLGLLVSRFDLRVGRQEAGEHSDYVSSESPNIR